MAQLGCALSALVVGCTDHYDKKETAGSAQAASPVSGAEDGAVCRNDADCHSGHCANHVCCADGECCLLAQDCGDRALSRVCEDPSHCQGTRVTLNCESFRCTPGTSPEDDDSACDGRVEADGCGLYAAVVCDGSERQQPPACPDACADDSACDQGARCLEGECQPGEDPKACAGNDADAGAPCANDCSTDADCGRDQRCANGVCEGKLVDGDHCAADAACTSGHCDRGLCCEKGDCCDRADDCPSAYTVSATCSMPEHCQGVRSEASCTGHICEAKVIEDDSACDGSVIAQSCGMMSVQCLGMREQSEPPPCPPPCSGDDECPDDQYCREGECVPGAPNGHECDGASMCASGYCGNGHCCASGFCCGSSADCTPIYACADAQACDGTRLDAICGGDSRCAVPPFATPVKDDSACLGVVARDCGSYRALYCGVGLSVSPGECASECHTGWDCSLGHTCQNGACE